MTRAINSVNYFTFYVTNSPTWVHIPHGADFLLLTHDSPPWPKTTRNLGNFPSRDCIYLQVPTPGKTLNQVTRLLVENEASARPVCHSKSKVG